MLIFVSCPNQALLIFPHLSTSAVVYIQVYTLITCLDNGNLETYKPTGNRRLFLTKVILEN